MVPDVVPVSVPVPVPVGQGERPEQLGRIDAVSAVLVPLGR